MRGVEAVNLMDLLEKYYEKFGESVPMIPVAWGRTEKELCEIIEKCLKEGKDVYQLGYAKEDKDVLY